jgi:sulfotransferase
MNKQLFFLVAMHRSGNTVFASIINQNPEIVCTANSITLEIMKDLFLLKETDVFKNYSDHDSLDNVMDSVYGNYYKDWPQQYIIDRGPVMTNGNLMLIQKHYRKPLKCIILVRDLLDVLASYIKWYSENPSAFVNKLGNTDEEKLSQVMRKDGGMAKNLEAIKNAYNYPEICHFIKYDDMVANPEKTFDDLYKFLGIKPFKHNFQNLKQIEINGIGYDDTIVGNNMHTIKTELKKQPNPYYNRIPERFIKQYGHIKF